MRMDAALDRTGDGVRGTTTTGISRNGGQGRGGSFRRVCCEGGIRLSLVRSMDGSIVGFASLRTNRPAEPCC